MGGDTLITEEEKENPAPCARRTCRRSGDAPVHQRPDSRLMNIYRPFVLRVLTGEAEVLDHEQMKPCNQSIIQAAVKVKGCTLHAFKRPTPTPFIHAGHPHGPLARADMSFISNRILGRCAIALLPVKIATVPLK